MAMNQRQKDLLESVMGRFEGTRADWQNAAKRQAGVYWVRSAAPTAFVPPVRVAEWAMRDDGRMAWAVPGSMFAISPDAYEQVSDQLTWPDTLADLIVGDLVAIGLEDVVVAPDDLITPGLISARSERSGPA